jgi:hypothetical protein
MRFGGPCLAMLLLLPTAAGAVFQRARDPDWPCQQIKVPTLSLAAVWAGPPIDPQQGTWRQDPEVTSLVGQITQRRTPIDEAKKNVLDFGQRAGLQREPRLLATMAGVFDVLNQQRDSVLAGLDRFGQRQKVLAGEIRSDNEKLQAMQADPRADANAVQQLTNQINLEVQMFQDRRQALSYACDVPSKIEQRLFGLAQAIQQSLGKNGAD